MRRIDEEYTRHPFYGVERMTGWLVDQGYRVNRKRVRRLMRQMGLPRSAPECGNTPTDGYPYLLRGIAITHPNHVWATDITYIRMQKGFVHLVAMMDLFSRYVLSWEVSTTLETGFCLSALDRVLDVSTPQIFNSDQGSSSRARSTPNGLPGQPFASGVYLYRLEAGGRTEARKMLLAR